ncbi:hypothetical protein ACXX9E_29435 [Pseudomonas sp. GNP014]
MSTLASFRSHLPVAFSFLRRHFFGCQELPNGWLRARRSPAEEIEMANDFDLYVHRCWFRGCAVALFRRRLRRKWRSGREPLGGTCVNVGCAPNLATVRNFAEDFEQRLVLGGAWAKRRFDWATPIANKDREINRLDWHSPELLRNSGVTLDGSHVEDRRPHGRSRSRKRFMTSILIADCGGRRFHICMNTPIVPTRYFLKEVLP